MFGSFRSDPASPLNGKAHARGAIRRLDSVFENIMQKLKNKTCVVTGAALGIGRAIAARFHDEGAAVIVTDIDEATGSATAAQIGCRFEPLDVREEADWSRLTRVVPVADVVVNNAGVTGFEAGLVPMIQNMPALRIGARSTGSISTARSSAVATRSAR